MFDWNDQEITNIIWGEARESGDHIVPYPDGSKGKFSGLCGDLSSRKHWNNGAGNGNPDEQTKSPTSTIFHQFKHASKAAKTDQAMGSEAASNNFCKHDYSRHGRSETFQNEQDMEAGGFVDYDWENIGSFDDLDRIFSNGDNPIFKHTSISNTEELWSSSSKSLDKSPSSAFEALRRSPFNQFETKSEYAYSGQQLSAGVTMPEEFSSKLFSCVQGNPKKRSLQPQAKSEEIIEVRQLPNMYGTSRNQKILRFNNRYAPTTGQPYPPVPMSQLLGSEFSQYKDVSGPYLAFSSMYPNTSNQYPPTVALPQLPSKVSPVFNTDHHNTLLYAPTQPPPMTPQEKIEKLRRRQQMRAMLAIQKQQQYLNNQVPSSTESPITEGAEKKLHILARIDPSSPLEQDDSNTLRSPENCSQDTIVLRRLQDIIIKLDNRTRLCIRDSLFRLAQSATQRQCASDTNSNKSSTHEVFNREERNSPNRFGKIGDVVETRTNPIDRTVAHLLFHSLLKSPPTNHTEKPGLPLPAIPCTRTDEADLIMGIPTTFQPQSSKSKKMLLSHDESEVSFLFPQGDESEYIPCFDTSENE